MHTLVSLLFVAVTYAANAARGGDSIKTPTGATVISIVIIFRISNK